MKMLSMKMATLFGGIGIMGYMYFKKHPELMDKMMKMGKDMTRSLYMYFDTK